MGIVIIVLIEELAIGGWLYVLPCHVPMQSKK